MSEFYNTLTTREGTVIQGFQFLYKKYREGIHTKMEQLDIPLNPTEILADDSLYRRFLAVFDKEKKANHFKS